MKTFTLSEFRSSNLELLLEQIVTTGEPVEIRKGKYKFKIILDKHEDKFTNLVSRPNEILCDPEELVSLSWESEVKIDLP